MSIISKIKQYKFQKGIVNLVGNMAKDSAYSIEHDKRISKSDGLLSDHRHNKPGVHVTKETQSYTIKSNDEKTVIELTQDFTRATGNGTRGIYVLNINGKRQQIDQKRLEKLFQLIHNQKSDDKKTNNPELAALLQKYVRE